MYTFRKSLFQVYSDWTLYHLALSLSFPSKKSSFERTCAYWKWIVCTMKKGNDRYLLSTGKTLMPCAARIIIFRKENLNHLIPVVCFTKCILCFQYVWFLFPICLPGVICGTYATRIKLMLCRDTSRGRHSCRFAWLIYSACLRSHVLRAYCNLETKQAISITLFGRRPNN